MSIQVDKLDSILDKYEGEKGALIQVLLDVQQEFNWIPQEAIKGIGQRLGIRLSQIYRVASFYKAMSLTPRGRHLVRVCLGTACHVRGGMKIMNRAIDVLGVGGGETTPDMRFTLERVNCLGCCALGPVMVVDKDYHGKLQTSKVEKILGRYE